MGDEIYIYEALYDYENEERNESLQPISMTEGNPIVKWRNYDVKNIHAGTYFIM